MLFVSSIIIVILLGTRGDILYIRSSSSVLFCSSGLPADDHHRAPLDLHRYTVYEPSFAKSSTIFFHKLTSRRSCIDVSVSIYLAEDRYGEVYTDTVTSQHLILDI